MSMQPIPEYGDLIEIMQFQTYVKAGAFIPYDGDGCWATTTEMDDNSDVWASEKPEWATHVVWFNR